MRGRLIPVGSDKYRHIVDLPRGIDGKRKQKTFTYSGNKKTAHRMATATIAAIDRGEYVAEASTLGDLFDRFLTTSKINGQLGAKTHERYCEIVTGHIVPLLGHMPLEKLTAKNVEDLYAYLLTSGRRDGKAGGLSLQTVLHVHRLLRRTLQKGLQWRMVSSNVADAVEPPKPIRPEMKVLNAEEVLSLLRAAGSPTPHCIRGGSLTCDPSFYAAVVFMVATGARRGECLAMRWQDINLDTGQFTIRRSLEQTRDGLNFKSPKNGKSRVMTLGRFGTKVLRTHRAAQAKDKLLLGSAYAVGDLVFARRDGTPYPPRTFGDAFRALVRRSGGPQIRLHDLRHTNASIMGQLGVPMKLVSGRLGHSGIGITADTYSHIFPTQDAEASSKFDTIFDSIDSKGCDTNVINEAQGS